MSIVQSWFPRTRGIDLVRRLCGVSRAGFPRTRGDRPLLEPGDGTVGKVPPHTRG